jgi:hypothetical protein
MIFFYFGFNLKGISSIHLKWHCFFNVSIATPIYIIYKVENEDKRYGINFLVET